MSFNKIIVVGNLGRDPELRYTPQGTPVCNFSMATNERRKGPNAEPQDITTWFKVTVWGKQAESVSRYLTKGRMVYVEGRLQMAEWIDKEGKQRFTLEVNATDVRFIDGGQSIEGVPAGQAQAAGQSGARFGDVRSTVRDVAAEEDEIPF
jgi:single-strand DNA-binding protein